jgi:hypothetical protein
MKLPQTSIIVAALTLAKFTLAAPAPADADTVLVKRCDENCYGDEYEACSSGCAYGLFCSDTCIAGCITEASKLLFPDTIVHSLRSVL